jgi:hypothetical protein
MKRLLGVLIVACGLMAPPAQAGMIGTDEAVQAQPQRERLKAFLERPAVVQQLKKLGVDAIAAQARVDAMGDSEVTQLAGVVDALPAGGVLSNQDLLLIIIVVLLVLLLI